MDDDELIRKYEAACSDDGLFGETRDEPYRTVSIIYMAQTAVDNGGLVMVFDIASSVSESSVITDAYRRIGSQAIADIIAESCDSFGIHDMTNHERARFIEENWTEAVDHFAQWNDRIFADPIWANLADWIRRHENLR